MQKIRTVCTKEFNSLNAECKEREDFVGDLYFDAGFVGSIFKKKRITLQAAFKPGERINMLITSAPGLVSPKGL